MYLEETGIRLGLGLTVCKVHKYHRIITQMQETRHTEFLYPYAGPNYDNVVQTEVHSPSIKAMLCKISPLVPFIIIQPLHELHSINPEPAPISRHNDLFTITVREILDAFLRNHLDQHALKVNW
jgi:hypothetical protein